MAVRNVLHKSKLDEFTAYMESNDWKVDPKLTNEFEVRRFKKEGRDTFIIYTRLSAKEHFSIKDKDFYLVKEFLKSTGGWQETGLLFSLKK